ncbi:hypothetical protein [Umezawaea sp.]|uniref:hypothetical protein n=1 Tax=Umezawaea sp. TaxID=1955258 RepID=UPI002ED45589
MGRPRSVVQAGRRGRGGGVGPDAVTVADDGAVTAVRVWCGPGTWTAVSEDPVVDAPPSSTDEANRTGSPPETAGTRLG